MDTVSQALKYIEERATKLSRYSDKLRQNLAVLFHAFKPSYFCRYCHQNEALHGNVKSHDFKPAIEVGIKVLGDPFLEEQDKVYPSMHYLWRLEIRENRMYLREEDWDGERLLEHRYYHVEQAPRYVLVRLVKSGAIPKFLHKIVEELEKTGREVGEAAELAEKIARAVQE